MEYTLVIRAEAMSKHELEELRYAVDMWRKVRSAEWQEEQVTCCDIDDCVYPAVKHLCEEHSDPKNT
jgi:hypothetical protein